MAKVILICGKICSGKSFLAKQLKEQENAVILSTDEATFDLIRNEQGEFYPAFAKRVNGYLRKKCVEIVRTGTNVILDWGFWSGQDRKEISNYFAVNGIAFEWHYINIGNDRWQKQIRERNEKVKNKTNCSDFYVDEGLLNKCLSLFEEPRRNEIDVWHENPVNVKISDAVK